MDAFLRFYRMIRPKPRKPQRTKKYGQTRTSTEKRRVCGNAYIYMYIYIYMYVYKKLISISINSIISNKAPLGDFEFGR